METGALVHVTVNINTETIIKRKDLSFSIVILTGDMP
jgi:hypothetical protein